MHSVAFSLPGSFPCARCAPRGVSPVCARRPAYMCAQTPRPGPSSVGHRVAAAVAAVAVSLLGILGPPRRAMAAATPAPTKTESPKSLRYDGRQELAGPEKAVSLALTGGAFAALAVWAYRKNREDDELEMVRIKDEVERLEKLKAEFENVEEDDDALDDDEFMAELNKRIAQDAAAENADENAGDDEDSGDPDGDASSSTPKASGTATIDRPTTGTDANAGKPQSDADIEKLRRMWEADSPGDDKRKPKQ